MEDKQFNFTVLPVRGRPPTSARYAAFLISDNWDDWFTYSTLYFLIVADESGKHQDVGGVKIGQFQMEKEQHRPAIPDAFEKLDESFFSLGQDDSYYQKLNDLGAELRERVLDGLRDIAFDPNLYERAIKEDVTTTSLFRSVTPTMVQGQFRRMARGGVRLSRYKFSYTAPRQVASKLPPLTLQFDVSPESEPPTNIHVLIGRNGVGKTYILNLMTQALIDREASVRKIGKFEFFSVENYPTLITQSDRSQFSNLVSVTFSAFDPFEPLPEDQGSSNDVRYSYIGLKRSDSTRDSADAPKSHDMLANEFVKSLGACLDGAARSFRWGRAVKMLEADPIFKEAEVASLSEENLSEFNSGDEFRKRSLALFRKLSSGHKIVLLTITRLVERVEERTLVLLDEPEAHLHPPLLSAFIRSLSDLLINRNGVAIVATHSPVVLQEVPKTCVWKLRRTGHQAKAERPEMETFGENVGVLTREVFGLELTQSGFHKILQQAVDEAPIFDAVIDRFHEQLGAEARAIVRALIAARNGGNDE